MRSSSTEAIIIFVIVCTLLIAILIGFIATIIYRYQQKQNAYYKNLEELKVAHSNEMLQTKIEIQEQTFENISREIHDNIGQKLTLAKLRLNTINIYDSNNTSVQLNDSVSIISEAINDLSDLSRSMSSEIILNNGFIYALEFEVAQLSKTCMYRLKLKVTGEPIFLDSQKELVLFRIVQEALNNIVKHACADGIEIHLHFTDDLLSLQVIDNGRGMQNKKGLESGTGIANMKRRANLLNGEFEIDSQQGHGTNIIIKIPIDEIRQAV